MRDETATLSIDIQDGVKVVQFAGKKLLDEVSISEIGDQLTGMVAQADSVKFVLERNPDYFDQDFALLDGIELPILSESAQRLAQFKAGNLHYYTGVSAQDEIGLKKEEPRLIMYESDFSPTSTV